MLKYGDLSPSRIRKRKLGELRKTKATRLSALMTLFVPSNEPLRKHCITDKL